MHKVPMTKVISTIMIDNINFKRALKISQPFKLDGWILQGSLVNIQQNRNSEGFVLRPWKD